MEFINLTPHNISIVDPLTKEIKREFKASGELARVTTSTEVVDNIDGIEITVTRFSEVYGLPEPEDGKIYLVSLAVAQRVTGRKDVLVPNGSVRDNEGRIIGCTSLARV